MGAYRRHLAELAFFPIAHKNTHGGARRVTVFFVPMFAAAQHAHMCQHFCICAAYRFIVV